MSTQTVRNETTHFLPLSLLQSVHNFTLPSWATEDVMTKLRELSELSLLSLYGIHKQEEKSRLQGGKYKRNEGRVLDLWLSDLNLSLTTNWLCDLGQVT